MAAIDYTLYVYIAPPALVAVVVSILSVWPYRRRRVATALIWYLVMVGAFLTTNVLELVSGSGVATIIWAKSSHMFFLGSGLAWLAFALSYSGYEALTAWRVYRWLALFPVVISVLIWSNELHGKFWAQVDLVRVGRFLAMQPQYGPWFWIHGVYLYTLLVAGVLLLIAVGARARRHPTPNGGGILGRAHPRGFQSVVHIPGGSRVAQGLHARGIGAFRPLVLRWGSSVRADEGFTHRSSLGIGRH